MTGGTCATAETVGPASFSRMARRMGRGLIFLSGAAVVEYPGSVWGLILAVGSDGKTVWGCISRRRVGRGLMIRSTTVFDPGDVGLRPGTRLMTLCTRWLVSSSVSSVFSMS